ncbi:MAG: hypothetical protein ACK5MV_03920 [Aminipila sp.]
MALSIEEVAARFEGVTGYGSKRQAKCPCHVDKEASLSITAKDGKILLHCHADCHWKDIAEAVGLSPEDIVNKPKVWKDKLEKYMNNTIEAVYDYKNERGHYLYTKVRFKDKKMIQGVIEKEKDFFNMKVGKLEKTLYRLSELIKAVREGYQVYIVEGEKDVETMRKLGYTATTAGWVSNWRKEFAQYFIGAKVIVLPDNDEPGLKLKDEILRDLKHYAHSTKWLITSKADKGDVSDYIIKEGHDKEDLKALIKAVPATLAPWIEVTEKKTVP